jgi:hypothetical protein
MAGHRPLIIPKDPPDKLVMSVSARSNVMQTKVSYKDSKSSRCW